jgi:hypothetical protein
VTGQAVDRIEVARVDHADQGRVGLGLEDDAAVASCDRFRQAPYDLRVVAVAAQLDERDLHLPREQVEEHVFLDEAEFDEGLADF